MGGARQPPPPGVWSLLICKSFLLRRVTLTASFLDDPQSLRIDAGAGIDALDGDFYESRCLMSGIASYELLLALIKSCAGGDLFMRRAPENRVGRSVSIYPHRVDLTRRNGGADRAAAAYQARSWRAGILCHLPILYLFVCMIL